MGFGQKWAEMGRGGHGVDLGRQRRAGVGMGKGWQRWAMLGRSGWSRQRRAGVSRGGQR